METLRTFVERSIEIQHWGWNDATVATIIIGVLNIFQCYSGIKQWRLIRKRKRADNVSMPLTSYMGFYSLSLVIYGYNDGRGQRSLAFMSMGVIGVVFLLVLMQVVKYQRSDASLWEKGLGAICFWFLPFMWAITNRDIMLILQVCVGCGFLCHQLYETVSGYHRGKLGDLEPAVAWVFFVSCIAWFILALRIGNIVFALSNPVAAIILALTLGFWYATKWRIARKRKSYIPVT